MSLPNFTIFNSKSITVMFLRSVVAAAVSLASLATASNKTTKLSAGKFYFHSDFFGITGLMPLQKRIVCLTSQCPSMMQDSMRLTR